jgi:G3E family GTPase
MKPRAQCLVVSGFLGSGKTTLVRRLLEQGRRDGVRTAVVSNEFGELGIDEALLAPGEGDFVELSGGCVCCRLSDDLLKTLQQLWLRARPERVIVETSGVALPYDTLINFWRDPVREWAVDESSVVVVSAEQVSCGRDLDATFVDQVCSADLLVLSKTDLVTEDEVRRAEKTLRSLQPDVTILRASFGDVDSRVFFPPEEIDRAPRASGRRSPERGDSHAHPHDAYRSEELRFEAGTREEDVRRVLEARRALRAKGFVETSAGLRLVQGVAGRIEFTDPPAPPPARLVGRVVVIERRPADEEAAAAARRRQEGDQP